jgi:long-subunit acyl-CoA synthetase (AMP-forming)
MFSIDNDILTPTMKLKRNVAAKYFKKEIAELYEEANSQGGHKAKL